MKMQTRSKSSFRIIGTPLALCLLLYATNTVANGVSEQLDDSEILVLADEYLSLSDNYTFDVRIVDSNEKQYDLTVRVRDRTKGLVEFTRPANSAGNALLYLDNHTWHHSAETGQTLRLPSKHRFLSGIDNLDLISTSFSSYYEVSDLIDDSSILQIELQSLDRDFQYSKVFLYVDSGSYRPVEAEYFLGSDSQDDSATPSKTIYFEDFRNFRGKDRLVKFRIVDHENEDAEAVLSYSALRSTNSPESWFTPMYLKRFN